jgi:hypothetical protein
MRTLNLICAVEGSAYFSRCPYVIGDGYEPGVSLAFAELWRILAQILDRGGDRIPVVRPFRRLGRGGRPWRAQKACVERRGQFGERQVALDLVKLAGLL